MKAHKYLFFSISYAVTIFLSAFLLFQVQPIIGKYILPWFGGTSFVWITTLLFFQIILLGGYFYSYLVTKFSLRQQVIFHGILVCVTAAITFLLFSNWNSPITPPIAIKLSDNYSPALQVLGVLLFAVGLPYFLLSTTSTLLQKWFSLLPHNKSPYPLYAISNTGSLLAILTYPFLIEPFLSLFNQGKTWSVIFLIVCLLLIVCGIQIFVFARSKATKQSLPSAELSGGLPRSLSVARNDVRLWFFLPAVSSLMLLAGTHQLTQGIAPIPFLWLIPLGLYLLSFILCFSERQMYKRNFYAYCFLATLPVVLARLLQPPVLGAGVEIILFAIMLFSCFMVCHGELFAIRPGAKNLNAFYLVTAFGSVIGAFIVAIIAPLFFVGLFWEFLLGLFFITLIAMFVLIIYKDSMLYRRLQFGVTSQKEMTSFMLAVVSFFYFIIGLAIFIQQSHDSLGVWRNFYGTLRINQHASNGLRCLLNGKIIHGCQPTEKKEQMKPTTYYGEKSVGLAIESLRNKMQGGLHVGAIGLGVGTIAAYGKKGDTFTFYELNPIDVDLAKKHFSYLSQTPATVAVAIGDGRLSLEKELREKKNQQFNILVVDAFNDDAIPVHLLTKEAFALYKMHLAPESILAVHISNSYIDLTPVIAKAAKDQHMSVVFIDAPAINDFQTKSKWAFVTSDTSLFETPGIINAEKFTPSKDIPLWTDDYSNLFQILRYF